MLLLLGIGFSVFLLLFELICFASAVRYPCDLKNFSYRTQRIVLCIIDLTFTIGILIVCLLQPTAKLPIVILLLAQLVVGSTYIIMLNILCTKKFFHNIAEEIKRLNLDVDQDLIELRRQLMSNSDISCSIKDLQKAINLIK